MNLAETCELIRTLRDCGAIRFKSGNFEVEFHADSRMAVRPPRGRGPVPGFQEGPPPEPPPEAPANAQAAEKLKGMINGLNLNVSDMALVDALFPTGPEFPAGPLG